MDLTKEMKETIRLYDEDAYGEGYRLSEEGG